MVYKVWYPNKEDYEIMSVENDEEAVRVASNTKTGILPRRILNTETLDELIEI